MRRQIEGEVGSSTLDFALWRGLSAWRRIFLILVGTRSTSGIVRVLQISGISVSRW